jgi:hypothetical protein
MCLEDLILQVLKEENLAGGPNSVFGPGVQQTATQFSGDNYAKGDARIPKSIFKGVQTRWGLSKSKKKPKKKKSWI